MQHIESRLGQIGTRPILHLLFLPYLLRASYICLHLCFNSCGFYSSLISIPNVLLSSRKKHWWYMTDRKREGTISTRTATVPSFRFCSDFFFSCCVIWRLAKRINVIQMRSQAKRHCCFFISPRRNVRVKSTSNTPLAIKQGNLKSLVVWAAKTTFPF